MSDKYITVEVSKKTAKIAKTIMIVGLIIGILMMLISGIFFASGDYDTANITIIISVGFIFLGLLIYMFIVGIASMKRTMGKKKLNQTALRIIAMVAGSLLLLVILVAILS